MSAEETVIKQTATSFASDRSETLTPAPDENAATVKKSGMEPRSDCGAKASLHAGGLVSNRGQVNRGRQLARPSVTEFWPGYDVSGQRPASNQSLAGQIRPWPRAHVDFAPPTKNSSYRQPGTDTANATVSDAMAGGQRQGLAGLRFYPVQTQGRRTDQSGALRRYRQILGVMAWLHTSRVFKPFDPAQQTGPHVLDGGRHRADFAAAGAPVDCQHHLIFGHYAAESGNGGLATPDDGGPQRAAARLSHFMRVCGRKSESAAVVRLVKIALRQTFFCQQSLTKPLFLLHNKSVLTLKSMEKLGKLAGALSVMGALAAPAAAQETNANGVVLATAEGTAGQVTDCVGFVREQRDLASETGIAMSRSEQRALLLNCQNGELAEMVAEQELILAALGEQIQQLDLRLDDQARIIDENNQVIAFIVTINGQWVIQSQLGDNIAQSETESEAARSEAAASRARQEEMLREAERILQNLATS